MEEYIRTEKLLHISNNNLDSTYFVCHTDNILPGKYNYLGLSNVFLVRYTMIPDSTKVSKIWDFKSFSDEYSGFIKHYVSNFVNIV